MKSLTQCEMRASLTASDSTTVFYDTSPDMWKANVAGQPVYLELAPQGQPVYYLMHPENFPSWEALVREAGLTPVRWHMPHETIHL